MTDIGAEELSLSGDQLAGLVLDIAARQDRQAFALLFKYFAPRLKTYLIRSGMSAGTAEEIAQEALLSVWRKASYFDPARAGAATWVFTIARNLRIDYLRRERTVDASGLNLEDEPDPAPAGEAVMLASERERQLRAALATLSGDQAVVVQLSFFSEKPHSEIARELGIPLGTVKSRVRLAMNRLRAMLEEAP